jgi:hypothetical protein
MPGSKATISSSSWGVRARAEDAGDDSAVEDTGDISCQNDGIRKLHCKQIYIREPTCIPLSISRAFVFFTQRARCRSQCDASYSLLCDSLMDAPQFKQRTSVGLWSSASLSFRSLISRTCFLDGGLERVSPLHSDAVAEGTDWAPGGPRAFCVAYVCIARSGLR